VDLAAERGQAMVEFVLVLPFLLLVLFGIVQLGMSVNAWNDLNQIAGSGVRRAAVNHDSTFNPVAYVCAGAEPSVRSTLTVTVSFPSGTTIGSPVQIVTHADRRLIPFIDTSASTLQMSGSAVMRLEVPPTFSASGPSSCP
jgi:hypothetical protein